MTTEKILGDAIVERLGKAKLDARAKTAAKTFQAQHKAFAALWDAAAAKEAARSAALEALGEIDLRLDAQISRLGDRLAGAGLSKRAAPFAKFSKYSPSDLSALAYAKQLVETTKLTKAVRKAKPTRDVVAVLDVIDREATALGKGLAAYDAAQKAFDKAAAGRDALLSDWQKALTRLRVLAKASMIDEPGAYDALFARPESIAIARKPRKKAQPPTQRPVNELN